MFPLEAPVLATLALAAGPVLFRRSFRDLRTRRLVQNTPTARIRSMPMGLVELNGQVEPRSEVRAPFSDRACVYWEVDVATRARRHGWQVVHRNASGHPFFLRDDTGVALVYPRGAQGRLTDQVEEECVGLALPDVYRQYLAEQHLGLLRLGALRFRERILEAGQHLYVLGSATPRARAIAISMDEEALQATGTEDFRAHRLQDLDHEVVAVIRRGENEKTFILSQQSERDLTAQLGARVLGELIAGPTLTLLGLGYWLLEARSHFLR